MNTPRATPSTCGSPRRGQGETPSPRDRSPFEPGSPVGADAWNVRSWALLTSTPAAIATPISREAPIPAEAPIATFTVRPADEAESAVQDGEREPRAHAVADGALGALGVPGARTGTPAPAPALKRTGRSTTGPADPVRELMHRHRELCERAVDPLEIAAALEAHGVTDRAAARFRHRDVFALAEELFARVPRVEADRPSASAATQASAPTAAPALAGAPYASHAPYAGRRSSYGARERHHSAVPNVLLPLLPAVLCAAALVLLGVTQVRSAGAFAVVPLGIAAAAAVGGAAWLALRRVAHAAPTALSILSTCWLTGYALYGDELLTGLTGPAGGGERTAGNGAVVALSLAFSVAPAVWCARWFAVRAGRGLAGSRSLDDFAAGTRPLVATAVVLFAGSLLGLQFAAAAASGLGARPGGGGRGAVVQPDVLFAGVALGVLLFTALLLTAHGFSGAASAGLAAACALEALALVVVLASRLPGADAPGRHVRAAVITFGPSAVSAAACGCAALALLAHASRALTGASAHHRDTAP